MTLARTGFGCTRADHDKPVETRMAESVYSQIIGYGWDEATARAYVKDTMSRRGPRTTVDELYKKYQLAGKHVLEVGSGLGNVLIEFGLRKVRAVGIEPGEEWSQIVDERLRLHGCDSCTILRAYGESLPFNDESFDFVISMQVLEHVTDPVRTIEEMYRVLRPGGICVTIAPNYFSFFETHYRVFWFPGMPRRLGAWYLKLRGRDPSFYLNHVNNVTFGRVFAITNRLPWKNDRLQSMLEKLRRPELIESAFRRALVRAVGWFGPAVGKAIYWVTSFSRPEINCVFRKI